MIDYKTISIFMEMEVGSGEATGGYNLNLINCYVNMNYVRKEWDSTIGYLATKGLLSN